MDVLALIPARSGSKGIPHKNIADFRGKPMLAHSVEQARAARSVTRVIVSTDSELYAKIAREYGADTPFLRPAEISGDLATDLEAFEHALKWLQKEEGYRPDICVHLRPTYPTRRVEDIDRCVELLESDPSCDSVRTVATAAETPFKMWFIGDGFLTPVVDSDIPEAFNMPRQALPQAYIQTANVDVVWSRVILEGRSMTGTRIRGVITQDMNDIDDDADLRAAVAGEALAGRRLVFDIDGVIATHTPGNDYRLAEPIRPTVELINALYDAGNTIVLFTARGTRTGIDWTDVTAEQMKRWGVKYHELKFGKPAADYYVDDKSVALKDLAVAVARSERKG